MMQQRLSSPFREGRPAFLGCKHLFFRIILLILSLLFTSSFLYAEVTLDGTLGKSGPILGPNYGITTDMGRQVGGNLFHSFGKFNIYTNESATFSGPGSIENIIARVTGGTSSWIDGRLRSEISGANLYLLNPAGVMFGSNASLDVSGSFHVTTADYLKLGQDGYFFATTPEKSSLTSAPPSAFGFLGSNPGKITIEASNNYLSVPAGRTLSVIGGDIQISAGGVLSAAGGRINVASVASPGEVTLESTGPNVSGFSRMGDITMTGGSLIYNSGTGGGDIYIRGGHFEMDGSYVRTKTFSNGDAGSININADTVNMTGGAQISSFTYDNGKGGDINITAAESLNISGTTQDGKYRSGIFAISDSFGSSSSDIVDKTTKMDKGLIQSVTTGDGDAGSINIKAKTTKMDKGLIQSVTAGDGDAGSININTDTLDMTGGAQISSFTYANGKGGNINIAATESLNISGTAQDRYVNGIFTYALSSGSGGSIDIQAKTMKMDNGLIQTATRDDGNAGSININTDTLDMTGGAQISSFTYANGKGGNINIAATESLNISGTAQDRYVSGIYANVFSSGSGGSIDINAKTIKMDHGLIEAATAGDGDAGGINIKADTVDMTGGTKINSSTESTGNGGTINITVVDSLNISGNSYIFANSLSSGSGGSIDIKAKTIKMDNGHIEAATAGDGDAGSINITAVTLDMTGGTQINSSTSANGKGGTINITAAESLNISGLSCVATNANPDANPYAHGSGGSIGIQAKSIKMDNGLIQAGTGGDGNAGNINITTVTLDMTGGTQINSSTESTGNGGAINITATESLNISGTTQDGRYQSSILANAYSSGSGGSIDIQAKTINVTGGAAIGAYTLANGNGGAINITAADSLNISGEDQNGNHSAIVANAYQFSHGSAGSINILTKILKMDLGTIQASTAGYGDAGRINIDTDTLDMTGGAQISSTTHASGKGGTINITAADSLNISGTTPDGRFHSGIFAGTDSSGSGGNIDIQAKTLKMDNGGIQASTKGDGDAGNITIKAKTIDITGGGNIRAGTSGKGLGGSIAVSASDSLNIQNGQISASTSSESAGGNIWIHSDGDISLSDNAAISSKSTGTGNAGGITINGGGSITLNNSTINTDTTNADGGNIDIKTPNLLYLYRSAITTSVQGGAGNGGNIFIDPTFVVLNGSDIIANAYGGNGGNINIISDYFLSSPDSKVEASSQLGVSGTVNITAPEVDISGSLTALPSTYLDLTSLLRDRCAAFADEKASSLVVTGQGGMPMEPDDYLMSP